MSYVGERNGCDWPFSPAPHVRANFATTIAPQVSPLPPPLRWKTPSPRTKIMPLKPTLPLAVSLPVTTKRPEPSLSEQSPSTKVNFGFDEVPKSSGVEVK